MPRSEFSRSCTGSLPFGEISHVGDIPDACFCVQVMQGGQVPAGSVGFFAGLMQGGAQMQPDVPGLTVARRPPYSTGLL